MELWLCHHNNKRASSPSFARMIQVLELQMIRNWRCLLHYPFVISGFSSKGTGIKVTLSFFDGTLCFVFSVLFFGLFWSPIQHMLQPMRKIKISTGRRKSVIMLLRLRLPFLAKFAPDYPWAD
jgi:hypothetical protein